MDFPAATHTAPGKRFYLKLSGGIEFRWIYSGGNLIPSMRRFFKF